MYPLLHNKTIQVQKNEKEKKFLAIPSLLQLGIHIGSTRHRKTHEDMLRLLLLVGSAIAIADASALPPSHGLATVT